MVSAMEPMHVMLVGHLYITRPNTFMNSQLYNLELSPLVAAVHCVKFAWGYCFSWPEMHEHPDFRNLGKKHTLVFPNWGKGCGKWTQCICHSSGNNPPCEIPDPH